MNRLKILISAYACEPGKGSEPGVGWNVATTMAKRHDVWVVTRSNNRAAISAELAGKPVTGLQFVYYDLPRWMSWWKRGARGVRPYYYLWQVGVFFKVRHLHRAIRFDLVHHVTFVKYWMPSFLAMLNVPFVWGPVGGGESTPARMLNGLGPRGLTYEALRAMARWIGEHDPCVRLTARRSARSLATTTETAHRLRRLGAAAVEVHSEAGLTENNLQQLAEREQSLDPALRFVSVGRLLAWKGFHLGLRAFAKAEVAHAEYWVIGDGPERGRLERLARTLGIERNVRFLGALSRGEALQTLKRCGVLVHPSLHDSGGWVCLEAMAAGLPVICLELGGPNQQVDQTRGVKIAATTSAKVVNELAGVMVDLASAPGRLSAMGEAARKRVASEFRWEKKGEYLDKVYREVVGSSERHV